MNRLFQIMNVDSNINPDFQLYRLNVFWVLIQNIVVYIISRYLYIFIIVAKYFFEISSLNRNQEK